MKQPAAKTSSTKMALALLSAASAGDVARVREVLSQGAEPDKRVAGKSTALIAAAQGGHLAVVRELLAANADPSFAHGGKRGTTALLEAVRTHHFAIAQALFEAGADLHHDWSGEGNTISQTLADECCNLGRKARSKASAEFSQAIGLLAAFLAAGGTLKPHVLQSAACAGSFDLIRVLLDGGSFRGAPKWGGDALMSAMLNGHEAIVLELLRRGAEPWREKELFAPVLHQAVLDGSSQIVEAFAELHLDLNGLGDAPIGKAPPDTQIEDRDARGNVVGLSWKAHPAPQARAATALITAVRAGKLDMVRLLVRLGASIEVMDADGLTALAWALKNNASEAAAVLRKAGAKEPKHLLGSPTASLIAGATEGDLPRVHAALAEGASVDALYEEGHERFTALLRAATNGHLPVVEELLKAGANPNLAGLGSGLVMGITPLMLAARHGHTSVVKRLLAAGAQLEAQQANLVALMQHRHHRGDSAMHEAAKAGHAEIVELLLQAGVSPSARSADSGTAVNAAAQSGDGATLTTMLVTKARAGKTPRVDAVTFLRAVESGNLANVRLLLAAGAVPSSRDRQGHTALASAAMNGDSAMVQLLLETGARPNCDLARTPLSELMCAASGGYADLIPPLMKAGAKPNERSHFDGATALHIAVAGGHLEAVKALLVAGASTELRDDDNRTPAQLAQELLKNFASMNAHPLGGKVIDSKAIELCAQLLASVPSVA